jgi:Zn finger protein HypA/HybF involved in hydrogenase expression
MARRNCPRCRNYVEEEIKREGNKVTKFCPKCNFVFVSYIAGKGYLIVNNEGKKD